MGRKGISPLIAAVLLIAFTMAVAGLAGPFLTEVTQDAQEGTQDDLDTVTNANDVRLEVMSSDFDESTGNYSFTVRNSGTSSAENFTLTITGDSSPVQKKVNRNLEPGDVKVFYVETDHSSPSKDLEIESRNLPVSIDYNLSKAESYQSFDTVDDFEDSDTSEYSVIDDTGGTFDATQNKPYEGSYSGEYSESDTSSRVRLKSAKKSESNSLPNYPSRGDKIEYYLYLGTDNVLHNFWWAFNSTGTYAPDEGYGLWVSNGDQDRFRIRNRNSGNNLESVTGVNWPQDTWIKIEIDFQDTITATATDTSDGSTIKEISGTDTNFDFGRIGWQWNGDSDTGGAVTAYVDDLKVK